MPNARPPVPMMASAPRQIPPGFAPGVQVTQPPQLPDPYDIIGDPVGLVRQLGTGQELIAGLLSAGVTAISFGDPTVNPNAQVIPITPEAGGPPVVPGGPMAGGPPMGPGPNLV